MTESEQMTLPSAPSPLCPPHKSGNEVTQALGSNSGFSTARCVASSSNLMSQCFSVIKQNWDNIVLPFPVIFF